MVGARRLRVNEPCQRVGLGGKGDEDRLVDTLSTECRCLVEQPDSERGDLLRLGDSGDGNRAVTTGVLRSGPR